MVIGLLLTLAAPGAAAEPPEVVLAQSGHAELSVVVGPDADKTTREAAAELADYLERIGGAEFEVIEGDGDEGLVVGVPSDFEKLPFDPEFAGGAFGRDHYLLRSTDSGLYLLGASPLAARFAVWDLLYRFGHRQFFPTETWEVIPEHDELRIAVEAREKPDYITRRGPRGAPRGDKRPWATEPWSRWTVRNRTRSSFRLSTGHAYKSIIRRNQEVFDEHPEYLADKHKFRISNDDLRALVVEDAVQRIENNPERDSISMEPSDGGGWSDSEASVAMGSISDRVVMLANEVAEAINELDHGEKYVGIYAYNQHSPPPDVEVHPNVIVSLATSFTRGGYTFDQILDGWGEKADMLGIREYYGVTVWSYSTPLAGAGNLDKIRDIRRFHRNGARFMNAESDSTWGGYGLGYYLASRALWDVGAVDRMDELIDDFLEKAFGPAKEPMDEFYRLIDGSREDPYVPGKKRQLTDHMVGKMFRLLREAGQLAADAPKVRARIVDLVLYTRYVDLYRRYKQSAGEDRQEAFDRMMRFAWRIRERMMAESVWLTRRIRRRVKRDEHVDLGESYGPNRPADRHRENADEPIQASEIRQYLREGIERHPGQHPLAGVDYERVEFEDDDLVPAGVESDAPRGSPLDTHFKQGNRTGPPVYIWTEDGNLPDFYFSAGHIYTDRGPLEVTLYDSEDNEIATAEIPPGKKGRSRNNWRNRDDIRHVKWPTVKPGLYRLDFHSTGQGFFWDYEPRERAMVTIRADAKRPLKRNWLRRHYFYVPEGTRRIVLYGALRQKHASGWHPAEGETIDWEAIRHKGNFSVVPVPEGRDGKVWAFKTRHDNSELRFLNIPGCLAYHPSELLLPKHYAEELRERGNQAQY